MKKCALKPSWRHTLKFLLSRNLHEGNYNNNNESATIAKRDDIFLRITCKSFSCKISVLSWPPSYALFASWLYSSFDTLGLKNTLLNTQCIYTRTYTDIDPIKFTYYLIPLSRHRRRTTCLFDLLGFLIFWRNILFFLNRKSFFHPHKNTAILM